MEDNNFWLTLWRIAGWTLFGVVATIASCSTVADQRIVDMVEKGVDPIEARCAIWGPGDRMQITCHEAAKGSRHG